MSRSSLNTKICDIQMLKIITFVKNIDGSFESTLESLSHYSPTRGQFHQHFMCTFFV